MITISVVHPYPVFYHGICAVVQHHEEQSYQCRAYASSAKEVLFKIQDWLCDIAIIGIYSKNPDDIRLLETIKKKSKKTLILIVSTNEFVDEVRKAFIKGANGFIYSHAPAEEFLEVIHILLRNEVYMPIGFRIHPDLNDLQTNSLRGAPRLDFHLTHREKEILILICNGLSNKLISEKLFISDQTVAVHRKNLFRKMGVKNSISLMQVAKEKKLVS